MLHLFLTLFLFVWLQTGLLDVHDWHVQSCTSNNVFSNSNEKKKKLEIERERSLIENSESKETLEFPAEKFQALFVVCFSSDLLHTPHSLFFPLRKNCSRTPHTHLL